MTLIVCNALMPGTADGDVEASIPEFRCQLPLGHSDHHAAVIEWTDKWPWFLERGVNLERTNL